MSQGHSMDVGQFDDETEFCESARASLVSAARDLLAVPVAYLTPAERELVKSIVAVFGREPQQGERHGC